VRIERSRENVFTVTATSQELSALVAGARMALERCALRRSRRRRRRLRFLSGCCASSIALGSAWLGTRLAAADRG